MKRLLLLGMMIPWFCFAQEEPESPKKDTIKHWSIIGQNTLTLNQASFSNWIGGGANNIGWIAGVNYNMTYENNKDLWENIVILTFGKNDTKGIGNRKSQDVINISTNYGRRIYENWYISTGTSLLTQFASGYEDGNNPAAKKISNFMAPGYVNAGAGFTYRPNDNFTMTLRPINARWTFVLDKSLQYAGNYGLKNNGDSSTFQMGFLGTALYRIKLMENINLVNTASVFSNYLNHPTRLVLAYNGTLNMKINKYISSILTLDLVYDHNQVWKTQVKQTFGVGLAYKIDNGVKRSKHTHNQTWK